MPRAIHTLALLVPTAALLAGCAKPEGDFPSLAQRPAEREYAAERAAPPRVRPPLPDDPAIPGRLAAFVGAARAGEADFARAYEAAQVATAKAGPAGSDSWTIAQEAVSRAIAAQAPVSRALADLEQYAATRSTTAPISPDDLARLRAAAAEVHRIAGSQAVRTQRLGASLSR
jgi:hypothetical protein